MDPPKCSANDVPAVATWWSTVVDHISGDLPSSRRSATEGAGRLRGSTIKPGGASLDGTRTAADNDPNRLLQQRLAVDAAFQSLVARSNRGRGYSSSSRSDARGSTDEVYVRPVGMEAQAASNALWLDLLIRQPQRVNDDGAAGGEPAAVVEEGGVPGRLISFRKATEPPQQATRAASHFLGRRATRPPAEVVNGQLLQRSTRSLGSAGPSDAQATLGLKVRSRNSCSGGLSAASMSNRSSIRTRRSQQGGVRWRGGPPHCCWTVVAAIDDSPARKAAFDRPARVPPAARLTSSRCHPS